MAWGCSDPEGPVVDSIDEIIGRALSQLSAVEISELGLSRETPLVSDDDGDGSVCNQGELELGGGNGGYIYRISLSVHPNLGHPDRLTDN